MILRVTLVGGNSYRGQLSSASLVLTIAGLREVGFALSRRQTFITEEPRLLKISLGSGDIICVGGDFFFSRDWEGKMGQL